MIIFNVYYHHYDLLDLKGTYCGWIIQGTFFTPDICTVLFIQFSRHISNVLYLVHSKFLSVWLLRMQVTSRACTNRDSSHVRIFTKYVHLHRTRPFWQFKRPGISFPRGNYARAGGHPPVPTVGWCTKSGWELIATYTGTPRGSVPDQCHPIGFNWIQSRMRTRAIEIRGDVTGSTFLSNLSVFHRCVSNGSSSNIREPVIQTWK